MNTLRRLPLLRHLYRAGYLDGIKAADREWALMLEMHMVGPGCAHHPTRGKVI